MNIFKILASGDGRINEPNVSAFLGYLLNPKKNHGIGDELLKRILQIHYDKNEDSIALSFLVDKNKKIKNLDLLTGLNFEILLEQSFKSNSNKKQIVDIVMICYENGNKGLEKSESIAKIKLSNLGEPKIRHIFLIENKINNSSTKENQLIEQYNATIDTLKELKIDVFNDIQDIHKIVSLIFVSPNHEKSTDEFEKTKIDDLKILKSHFHWDSDNEDEYTICGILKSIFEDESKGDIEPIDEYAKYTIKSFIRFIENGFTSSIQEENDGKWKKIVYTEDEYKKVMIGEPMLNLAMSIKNELIMEFKLTPKYTPTYIPFYPKGAYLNSTFRVFCGITLLKNSILIGIQKDIEIPWSDFKKDLKKKYSSIKINENTSYKNSWYSVYIESIEEFKSIAMPLIKSSWDLLSKI